MKSRQSNYNKSNRITRVEFAASMQAQELCRQLLIAKETNHRQPLSEQLLDELSDCAQIDIVKVKISDTQQYHKKKNGRVVFKQYGYYRPEHQYVYIQNRTAVRGQLLASKTFIDTLLHEWLHHYDHKKLNLDSIHTAGFYARLAHLKQLLEL